MQDLNNRKKRRYMKNTASENFFRSCVFFADFFLSPFPYIAREKGSEGDLPSAERTDSGITELFDFDSDRISVLHVDRDRSAQKVVKIQAGIFHIVGAAV